MTNVTDRRTTKDEMTEAARDLNRARKAVEQCPNADNQARLEECKENFDGLLEMYFPEEE